MKLTKSIKHFPLIEFSGRLFNAKRISSRGIVLASIYYIKLVLVLPGAALQHILYNRRINKTVIEKDPVFILGHYRSGTTYLHKLMAADQQFGFINHYDILCPNTSLLFGKWLQNVLQFVISKLKIKTAFFNNTIPQLEDAAEEERFLINKASAYTDYWRFVFPRRWKQYLSISEACMDEVYFKQWSNAYLGLVKFATYKSKGKQLVLKSPENTGRIKLLLQLFPNAKFVYISRDPVDVYYSMMNLWERAIKKFALQQISNQDIEEIVFDHYAQLTDSYLRDRCLIPQANLVELRFDEIEKMPLQTLSKIYTSLSLKGFEKAINNFKLKLIKESSYKKYVHDRCDATTKRIYKHWYKYVHAWKLNTSTIGDAQASTGDAVFVHMPVHAG